MYSIKKVDGYKPNMSLRDTQKAIKLLKDTFEKSLATALNLERVSAPMMVYAFSGINDDLSGHERPVRFDIKEIQGKEVEIVHSLAKWKRMALGEYGFSKGQGLYTDMNAIRRDDELDNLHSIYVDQWDWECIVDRNNRNIDFLKSIVKKIVDAIIKAQNTIKKHFSVISSAINKDIFFIDSQKLLEMYPNLDAKQREFEITKLKKTVFILRIGDKLSNTEPHGARAPDYDDWQLNGDLIIWSDTLCEPIEISSMGIRVDSTSMQSQLKKADKEYRTKFKFHQGVINDNLPLTIGGGIGQSRLCMLLLQKAHIGEVQASVWPEDMIEELKAQGIVLL